MEKQIKNLSNVLSDLQKATNHCSMSVHKLLNKLSQKDDNHSLACLNKKEIQYLLETLDGLQEIRKLSIRKKSLNLLNLNSEPSLSNWDKIFENILSQMEIQDRTNKNVKMIFSSKGASNYGRFLKRDIPTYEVKMILPASPWLSNQITKD